MRGTRRAHIQIELEDELLAVIEGAIMPEAERSIPRTTVSISRDKTGMSIRIDAQDTVSLRAALNSYLRWVHVALETSRLKTQEG